MTGTRHTKGRILIVGASSGLGRLMVEEFVGLGWRVGAAARNVQALSELNAQCGGKIEWSQIDITENDAPRRAGELVKRLGGIDVYVHVSGICYENPMLEIDEECRVSTTNVTGFTRMMAWAFDYFKTRREGGHIAAITSVAGTKGIGDLAAYSASKRYQATYIQALEQLARREGYPIRFSDIRPGWTRTPLIDPTRRYMMAMNPAKVAHTAVNAIINCKRVKYIDWRWRLLCALWRLMPSGLWTRLPIHSSTP